MTDPRIQPVGMLPLWVIPVLLLSSFLFPININRDDQLTMASIFLIVIFILLVIYIYIDHTHNKKLEK